MIAALLPKVVFGVSLAAGTGVGAGCSMWMSKRSSSKYSNSVPKSKRCDVYKIWASSTGETRKSSEEEVEKELGKDSSNYKEIKKACDAAGEGDIFLSGSNGRDWRYLRKDQNHSKVKEYVRKNFNPQR